jgi:Transcriptional regulators
MSKSESASSRLRRKIGDYSLTKAAYMAIKDDIMFNRIKAGECLSGCRLARKLNMSRTPVREAISILENEGFVEIHNGVGIFVKEITEKDIMELVEVRTALECSALESSTLNLDRAGLEKLLSAWEKMQTDFLAGVTPDLEEIMTLDYETHDFLVACSRNSYLIELTQNVAVRFKRMQYLSVMALGDVLETIEQHLVLLRRIQDGSLEEAVRLLKVHIKGVETYVFHQADIQRKRSVRRKSDEAEKNREKRRKASATPTAE